MKVFALVSALFSGFRMLAQETPAPPPVAIPVPPVAPAVPDAPVVPEIPDDGTRVAVLGYHDFAEGLPETAMRIHTSKFRKQMEAIRQLGIKVITYQEFVAWKKDGTPLPAKCVLLTFDDGWKSAYTDAFPILKEYGYPFTLYLYKNYVDGGGKAMSTAMIQEMIRAGASLGSHSVSHPFPQVVKGFMKKGPAAYDAYLRKEMGESKQFLETKFAPAKVSSYAYPGGFHTPEMITLSKELGYDYLFTVIPGKIKRDMENQTLPRYMILGNYDKIFEMATTFHESGPASVADGSIAPPEKLPYPVLPESGAIINSRLPEISADLSTVPNLDPATLSMKVAGFGEVPASFAPDSKKLSWHVNRRLRQPNCQVSITWKQIGAKTFEEPLRWTFQIDRESAYLPDGE